MESLKERSMKNYNTGLGLLGTLCVLTLAAPIVHSQEKNTQGAIQVHMVITNEAVRADSDVPVNLTTEVSNAEIAAADNVWVPAGK
jgi:hypothetical protein